MLDTGIPGRFPPFYVIRNAEFVPPTIKNPVSPIVGDQGVFDMFDRLVDFHRIATATLLGLSLLVAACGSGSSSGPEPLATGTVALLLTDLPTDDIKEINFDVVEATLIGDQGQQGVTIYEGNTRVNLLDLQNFSQPLAVSEVAAGTYTKLRLRIENFEIIDDDPDPHTPRPPANGRIDLLQPGGIEVVPGRVLIAHVDMDANKSIHLVQTGNGKYRLRPVVRVQFMLDGLPDELVRIEGTIVELGADPGDFVLCSLDDPDTCFDVSLAPRASVFDTDGTAIDPVGADTFAIDDMVVVIGTYIDSDGNGVPDIGAIIVEKGPAEQVRGIMAAAPDAEGLFLLIESDGVQKTVELQTSYTKIFGPGGEALTADALQVGQGIEVDGVIVGDPAMLRAALILLDSDENPDQLSGTIALPISDPEFVLSTATGDVDVCVNAGATITVIGEGSSDAGSFADIQEGQTAYVFGQLDTSDGCFDADYVVVDTGE